MTSPTTSLAEGTEFGAVSAGSLAVPPWAASRTLRGQKWRVAVTLGHTAVSLCPLHVGFGSLRPTFP